MTGPAEKPAPGPKHAAGLVQLVRWLNDERPVSGPDDFGFAGAPRRIARWSYGNAPVAAPPPEPERDVLGEVRIGPAPRCAVAGETIALSVSLISTRGGTYLGWPNKLEWSSSDPSVATVTDGGIVDVKAKGRVELTCRCEDKSASVLLTVVDPAVAAAVGLPVPARLLAASRKAVQGGPRAPFIVPQPATVEDSARTIAPADRVAPESPTAADLAPPAASTPGASFVDVPLDAATRRSAPRLPLIPGSRPGLQRQPVVDRPFERPLDRAVEREVELPVERHADRSSLAHLALTPQLRAEVPPELWRELEPIYRRSVERGVVRRGLLGPLSPSRATRQLLFRLTVGAATGGFIAVALSQSPEDYFVVGPEASTALAAQMSASNNPQPRRASTVRAAARLGSGIAVPVTPLTGARLGDTSNRATLTETRGRTVTEAAGAAAVASITQSAASAATPAPAAKQVDSQPVAARTPTVSRVVVESPSQLMEGESVRLAAAGVDDRGDAVAGRAVTWRSEDTEVAVVDANGVVTAKRAGTVTIVASSEGRVGRVTLSVGARKAPPPSAEAASAPAPARESSPAAAAQVIRTRVDDFMQALRERNPERVAALYNAESPQDRKNLQALLERLRRPEARFKASDAQLAGPEVRELEATVDFHVPMSWTTPFGRVRNQTATFRAVLEPGDGGWRLVSIRAVGKIE